MHRHSTMAVEPTRCLQNRDSLSNLKSKSVERRSKRLAAAFSLMVGLDVRTVNGKEGRVSGDCISILLCGSPPHALTTVTRWTVDWNQEGCLEGRLIWTWWHARTPVKNTGQSSGTAMQATAIYNCWRATCVRCVWHARNRALWPDRAVVELDAACCRRPPAQDCGHKAMVAFFAKRGGPPPCGDQRRRQGKGGCVEQRAAFHHIASSQAHDTGNRRRLTDCINTLGTYMMCGGGLPSTIGTYGR